MNNVQRKNSLLLLVILLLIVICAYFAYEKYKYRHEEGLVYLSFFQSYLHFKKNDRLVVFSNPSTCNASKAQFKDLPNDIFEEFEKVNNEDAAPIRLSVLEGEIPIVSWEDTKNLHRRGIENAFRPPGHRLLSLSRVGFNKSKDKALICIEVSDVDFYGTGSSNAFYLEKNKGKWDFAGY